MLGYLNRPEKTSEVFVANPWSQTDPSGTGMVYRTGDRVRWQRDRDPCLPYHHSELATL